MTKFTSEKKGGTIGSATLDRPRGLLVAQMDINEAVAAAAKNGQTIVSGDTLSVITIPARSKLFIHGVYNETALTLGTSGTFSLGDTGSATAYVNAASTMTSGASATLVAAGPAGVKYDTASELLLTLSNSGGTITSGTICIFYELLDLSARSDGTPVF